MDIGLKAEVKLLWSRHVQSFDTGQRCGHLQSSCLRTAQSSSSHNYLEPYTAHRPQVRLIWQSNGSQPVGCHPFGS